MRIRSLIKTLIPERIRNLRRSYLRLRSLYDRTRPMARRHCPICNYQGYFEDFGYPPRLDAVCPGCGSGERHRLFWLWFAGDKTKLAQPILHFAAEPVFENAFRHLYEHYKTADLVNKADLRLNIENIALDSASVKTVICNHVLEHVDDSKALAEISRILTDDGVLLCSVPIVDGWEKTYENASVMTDAERELHFGQHDHVRYYGRDFRDRLRSAGFNRIQEYTAEGEAVVKHSLLRGDKIFICSRS